MVNKKNNIITLLLLLINGIFILYYIVLSLYFRPHYDDLHFMWKLKEMSISNYVSEMYFSRSGRFVAYFLNGIIFKIINFVGEYRFFPLLFGLLGVYFIWFVSTKIFKNAHKFYLLNIILFFYNVYILTNIDFPVFYWLCALSYYILVPLLILEIYFINIKKLNFFQWICLIIISLFLGGGQEAFTPVVFFVLLCNLIYYYFFKYKCNLTKTIKNKNVVKIFMIFVVILISFIVVIIAPGNYARMNDSQFVTPTQFKGFLYGYVNAFSMFFYYFSFYIPYYIIVASVFVYFLRDDFYLISIVKKYSLKKIYFFGITVYFIYFIISASTSVYLWSGFGIQRNYTHVVFVTMFLFCYFLLFTIIKYRSIKIDRILYYFITFGLIIMSSIMILNIINDANSANKYATSVDSRINFLNKLEKAGNKQDIYVEPIVTPYTNDVKYEFYKLFNKKNNIKPVLYYISDTDTVPNEYAYHLSKVFGYHFKIKLKNK